MNGDHGSITHLHHHRTHHAAMSVCFCRCCWTRGLFMLLHSSLSPSLQCRLIGQSDLLSDSWCGQPPSTATPLTTSVAVVKCICDVYLVFEHKTPVRILAAAHHACNASRLCCWLRKHVVPLSAWLTCAAVQATPAPTSAASGAS